MFNLLGYIYNLFYEIFIYFYNLVIPLKRGTYHITTYDAGRKLFSKDMSRPKNLGLGNLFERWLGDCMGCVETGSGAWGKLKIIFRPIFEYNGNLVNELMDDWNEELSKMAGTCKTFQLEQIIYNIPLKLVLYMIFGRKYILLHQKFFDELQELSKNLMSEVFFNKWARYCAYRYLPTRTNESLVRFNKLFEIIVRGAIGNNEGLLDSVWEIYIRNKDIVTEKMFFQTLAEIIYANQDVSIPSMAWLITHYIYYGHLLEDNSYFIEESARISPVFPVSVPRILLSKMELNGKILEKNTSVCIDFEKIGRGASWKMDDLDVFKPSRFSEIDINKFVGRFGFGGRKCPGNKLADILFNAVLNFIDRGPFTFIPKYPIAVKNINNLKILTDKNRPFSMPLLDAWVEYKIGRINEFIFCNCSPSINQLQNGFIGISTYKKSPFLESKEKVYSVIQAIGEQHNESAVLIADEISHYNIQAFERKQEKIARKIAKDLGDSLFEIFSEAANIYTKTYGRQIKIIRWSQLNLPDISEELESIKILDSRITKVADSFINKRCVAANGSYFMKMKFTKKYIYSELQVLVCGIQYNSIEYKSLYYSGSSEHLAESIVNEHSLWKLVYDIITADEFKDVRDIIKKSVNSECRQPGFTGFPI